MERKVLVISLIILVAGAGSVFGMNMAEHGGFHTCPISLLLGGDCPPPQGIALSVHHVSGLRILTQAIPSSASALLFLSLFFLVFFISVIHRRSPLIRDTHVSAAYTEHKSDRFTYFQEERRWLALHNTRNPHTLAWAYERS